MSATERKLTVQIEAFTPRVANTLVGFCTVLVPEMHLRIIDIGIHQKGAARWASLPAKPQITRAGSVRRDERGKPAYSPVMEFVDRATRDAFSHRVIAALLEYDRMPSMLTNMWVPHDRRPQDRGRACARSRFGGFRSALLGPRPPLA
jgi:hypothetical protein